MPEKFDGRNFMWDVKLSHNVTQMSYELLKDKYDFLERGYIDVKGKGQMKTYLLKGRK